MVQEIPAVTPALRLVDDEVFKSPLDDFKKAIDEAGLGDRFTCLSHGETYNFEVAAERVQAA